MQLCDTPGPWCGCVTMYKWCACGGDDRSVIGHRRGGGGGGGWGGGGGQRIQGRGFKEQVEPSLAVTFDHRNRHLNIQTQKTCSWQAYTALRKEVVKATERAEATKAVKAKGRVEATKAAAASHAERRWWHWREDGGDGFGTAYYSGFNTARNLENPSWLAKRLQVVSHLLNRDRS